MSDIRKRCSPTLARAPGLPVIAVALLLGACDGSAVAPITWEDFASASAASDNVPTLEQMSTLFDPFGFNTGISGTATLTRTVSGVQLALDVDGLTVDYAYTVWFVVFDNPPGCAETTCFPPDLGEPQAHATVQNAGGFVADAASRMFESDLDRHDAGGREVILGTGGITNPYRAQVDIVVRSHGPAEADADDRAAQTSQFGAFCNLDPNQDTDLAADGCYDAAVASFAPPVAPGGN